MLAKILIVVVVAAFVKATPIVQDPEGKVVGGGNVALGQVSHMVSLRSLANVHFCGAAILNNRWVLSSGTCAIGREATGINVVVGTVTTAAGVTYRSARIVLHYGFDPITLANDISLIQTGPTIAFTANIQPAPISLNITGGGVSAQMSGWGLNAQFGGAAPANLQRINTFTITNADCRSRLRDVNSNRVFDNKLCAFTQGAAQGTCFGDEGGALVSGGQIIGISSWQSPCAVGFPDVYERLADKRLWILSIIQ